MLIPMILLNWKNTEVSKSQGSIPKNEKKNLMVHERTGTVLLEVVSLSSKRAEVIVRVVSLTSLAGFGE